MNKNFGKFTNKKVEYLSACKKIRIESDSAAKVLTSLILNGYDREEKHLNCYSSIALIESIAVSAEAVVGNMMELVNGFDHRFSFILHDYNLECEGNPRAKVIQLVNEMHHASELNPLTIHLISNMSERFFHKDIIKLFGDMLLEGDKICCIFIADEGKYYSLTDKLDYVTDMHPVWLHRLPGEIDINQHTQEYSLERTNLVTVKAEIFIDCARVLMNRAQRQADIFEEDEIGYKSLLLAAAEGVDSGEALSQCLNLTKEDLQRLRKDAISISIRGVWSQNYNPEKYFLDTSAEQIVRDAIKLASASGYPDPKHPGLVSAFHLIGALSMCRSMVVDFGTNSGIKFGDAVNKIADWYYKKKVSPALGDSCEALSAIGFKQGLHRKMIGNIFGQLDALEMVNEVFCLNEFINKSSKRNNLPTTFLFLGPGGVGKGYFARLIAETYGLDMQYYNLLFHADALTLPVGKKKKSSKKAILIYENVSSAQPSAIDELCQLIEYGKIWNTGSGDELDFTNAIIIIIANSEAILELINEDCQKGRFIVKQNAAISILPQLNDTDNNRLLVPARLLSVLKKDHVIVFHPLQHGDLLNICARKLVQFGSIVEATAAKRLTFDPQMPYIIVLSEGGKPKPSALATAVEMLISTEVRKFISGFAEGSALHLLMPYDRLHFAVEDEQEMIPDVVELFRTIKKPKAILLTKQDIANNICATFDHVDIVPISTFEELEVCIRDETYDFILLDMWLHIGDELDKKKKVLMEFFIGRGLGKMDLPFCSIAINLFGEKNLRLFETLFAQKPVILLNRMDTIWNDIVLEYFKRSSSFYLEANQELRKIRENYLNEYPIFAGSFRYDLFLEFLESYHLRGVVNTEVTGLNQDISKEQRDCFIACIEEIHQRLHREKMAQELFNREQSLGFTPRWELNEQHSLVTIRLKDLHLINNILS